EQSLWTPHLTSLAPHAQQRIGAVEATLSGPCSSSRSAEPNRIARFWFRQKSSLRDGPRRVDATHHRDRCRVAGLPKINAYVVSRPARRVHQSQPCRVRHTAIGLPHRDGERENEIVVLAGSRVERQVTSGGKLDTEILELPDQCLGFVEFAVDLEAPL